MGREGRETGVKGAVTAGRAGLWKPPHPPPKKEGVAEDKISVGKGATVTKTKGAGEYT